MPFNDWLCPRCQHSNFEKRDKCRKCDCFRSKSSRSTLTHVPRTVSSSSTSSPSSSTPAHAPSSSTPTFKPGDWFCDSCAKMNFATRLVCYRCGKEKPHATDGPISGPSSEQPLSSPRENGAGAGDDDGRGKCVICLVTDPEVVFTKCGHLICCFTCSKDVRKCPMCRKPFTPSEVLRVFTP